MNVQAEDTPFAKLGVARPALRCTDCLPDSKVEKHPLDDLLWSEGPLWDAKRKTLLFSDIPRNVIMQWNDDQGVSQFLQNSGYTGAAPFTGRSPDRTASPSICRAG